MLIEFCGKCGYTLSMANAATQSAREDVMMTKAQVVAEFKESVLPLIRKQYEQDRQRDLPARREAWNNYTDMLCKDGSISDHAYATWVCPACCE